MVLQYIDTKEHVQRGIFQLNPSQTFFNYWVLGL